VHYLPPEGYVHQDMARVGSPVVLTYSVRIIGIKVMIVMVSFMIYVVNRFSPFLACCRSAICYPKAAYPVWSTSDPLWTLILASAR